MNEHLEPADDSERAVATLLADVGETAKSTPSRFTAEDIKHQAGRRRSPRRPPLDRYRRPAWAWLAVIAVLAAVLVFGVRLTTLSTPRVITPATHPSTKTSGVPKPTTTTSPKISKSTSTTSTPTSTTPPSTSTTVAGLLPVFLAPGYDGRDPVDIYLSGDAGNIVTNLEWSTWTGVEAVGYGTSNKEGCVPDCAAGTQTPEATTIVLSDPVDGHYTRMAETREGYTEIFTYPPSLGHPWAEEAYSTPPS
jgi:hypothetical protein